MKDKGRGTFEPEEILGPISDPSRPYRPRSVSREMVWPLIIVGDENNNNGLMDYDDVDGDNV